MQNNPENKSQSTLNDAPSKIKTAFRKVRKEVINILFPLRDQWISDKFKNQKIHNDWYKECIFYHDSELGLLEKELKSELRLLKEALADERKSNQALREELAIFKRIFPNFFLTPEKANEVLEPEEKMEPEEKIEEQTVTEEPSKPETVIVSNEKETDVLENRKEKKISFFAKLFKTKPANVAGKDEKKESEREIIGIPSSEKRGFFARLFKTRPAE